MSFASQLLQPSIRLPLQPPEDQRRAFSFGVLGLRSRANLYPMRQTQSSEIPIEFVVDSGASYSMISLEYAQLHDLEIPPEQTELPLSLRMGMGESRFIVRPGRIRCWWNANRQGYHFDWPILFRVDAPPTVPPVLGLGGVIQTCRWTFEGTWAANHPYGFLQLDDIRG